MKGAGTYHTHPAPPILRHFILFLGPQQMKPRVHYTTVLNFELVGHYAAATTSLTEADLSSSQFEFWTFTYTVDLNLYLYVILLS